MDNKLSELSKPVGFVSKLAQTFLECGETASIRPFFDVQGSSPLYSQEYVSALLQRGEKSLGRACKLGAKLEVAEQHIAELEAVKADASQVFKEIGNELGCNPDNESIMMAIDALKERLATPVRLPRPGFVTCSGERHYTYGADEVKGALHAAGFTFAVEGGE